MGLSGAFHLSRNEWERALETENHAFHLWAMYPNRNPSLAVISPQDMQSHVPIDQGMGSWESVEISFETFQDRFTTPAFIG